MKQITKTRKAVATIANQLRKLGCTLSKAFKTVGAMPPWPDLGFPLLIGGLA